MNEAAAIGTAMKFGGVAAALSVAIVVILIFVLKWVFKHMDELIKQMAEERKAFVGSIQSLQTIIGDHNTHAGDFHRSVFEAHGYQREEHREINTALTRLATSNESLCDRVALAVKGLEHSNILLEKAVNGKGA